MPATVACKSGQDSCHRPVKLIVTKQVDTPANRHPTLLARATAGLARGNSAPAARSLQGALKGCGAARTDAEHQGWAEPITLFQKIQLAGNGSKAIAILSDRQT